MICRLYEEKRRKVTGHPKNFILSFAPELQSFPGVPDKVVGAEIKPVEPDQGNACAGKVLNIFHSC